MSREVTDGPFSRLRSLETGRVFLSPRVIDEKRCGDCDGTGRNGYYDDAKKRQITYRCVWCGGLGKLYVEGGS